MPYKRQFFSIWFKKWWQPYMWCLFFVILQHMPFFISIKKIRIWMLSWYFFVCLDKNWKIEIKIKNRPLVWKNFDNIFRPTRPALTESIIHKHFYHPHLWICVRRCNAQMCFCHPHTNTSQLVFLELSFEWMQKCYSWMQITFSLYFHYNSKA